jgi:hypothetical protein
VKTLGDSLLILISQVVMQSIQSNVVTYIHIVFIRGYVFIIIHRSTMYILVAMSSFNHGDMDPRCILGGHIISK